MGAVNRIAAIGLMLAVLPIGAVGMETAAEPDAVLRLLQLKANAAALALSERIGVCDRVKSETAIPSLDAEKLSDLGVSEDAVRSALAFLSRRNYGLCEGHTRPHLAYELATFREVASEYGRPIPELENLAEVNAALIYPSAKDVELEVAFRKLPVDAQTYLNEAVGNDPFDLVGALSQLRKKPGA